MEKKRMNEAMFTNIKTLIDHGLATKTIVAMLDISPATVYRVKTADSFAAYTEHVKKISAPVKTEEPKAEPVTTPVVTRPSDYQINRLYELAKEQNELLKSISAKLAFIVEQLS